jgi:hypothetical protein
MLLRKPDKARPNILPNQILRLRIGALSRDLHLQLTRPKPKIHDRLASLRRGLLSDRLLAPSSSEARTALPRALQRSHPGVVLLHLVVARYAEVDAALADKGRDVGRGQEDEGDGQVLDQGYVQAVLAAELDVCAFEEVEGGLEEAALWVWGKCVSGTGFCL